MKTYKQLINELSLTTLVRYRELAKKDRPWRWNPRGKDRYRGIALATKKINRKMHRNKLDKPLDR